MKTERVLFLCTHNSARSQIAEGYLRAVVGDRFAVASAGTQATRVHPLALVVMEEIGISLAEHTSKTLDAFLSQSWDYVITVCDNASEHCPVFPPPAVRLHWSFPDPSQTTGTEGERLQQFRRVRDKIIERIRAWVIEERSSL